MSSAGCPFEAIAQVRRGGAVESWHFGAVAVVGPDGELVAHCGDPEVEVFIRSAAKPFQILPLVVHGGIERFELSVADVALICASHSGNPEHVERARRLLGRIDEDESALRCGSHPPMNVAAAEALRAAGAEPGPLHNNCSGKHAGLLLACRLLDLSPATYEADGHPVQEMILAEIERFFDLDRSSIDRGVDGCSLPTFRVPLRSLAHAYARLADPRASGLEDATAGHVDTIYAAMTGAPDMVAGAERFTTRLMAATGGRVLGKEGAEGVYALAVRSPRPLGIALKIADGSERCRDGVVVELLASLGCLTPDDESCLGSLRRKPLENWRGRGVGEILTRVELSQSS